MQSTKEPAVKLDLSQVEQLAKLGLTDTQIGAFFHLSERTINRYKKNPEFKKALQGGKDVADEKVKRALYQQCFNQEYFEDEIKNGKVILRKKKLLRADTTAQIFWLKNRCPLEFRDRREITGPDGDPITLNIYMPEKDKE